MPLAIMLHKAPWKANLGTRSTIQRSWQANQRVDCVWIARVLRGQSLPAAGHTSNTCTTHQVRVTSIKKGRQTHVGRLLFAPEVAVVGFRGGGEDGSSWIGNGHLITYSRVSLEGRLLPHAGRSTAAYSSSSTSDRVRSRRDSRPALPNGRP
jgi:hypothetical protein